jgi:hypothetical protein
MSMGMVYINVTEDEKLFKQLNYFSPPVLLLFFVRSGMQFKLNTLTGASVSAGTVPLIVVSAAYVAVRMIGKYAGAFAGCAATGKRKEIRNYLGLALMPQAGVTIGLAELGARTLGVGIGDDLLTVMLASGVIYEIIGPICAKIALYRTHSYSDKLEDITAVSAVTESGKEKTEAELLIERIQAIQKELPAHPAISEEEQAFDDAAEEQYEMMEYLHNKKFKRK